MVMLCMCAHIASWKSENYACQHAHLKGPNGDTYECKWDTMSQHDYFKKGLYILFSKKCFFM
jgi:hypothetical protein